MYVYYSAVAVAGGGGRKAFSGGETGGRGAAGVLRA